MSLPPLPKNSGLEKALGCSVVHYKDVIEYGQACRADLIALVQAVHKAKGRYHSQIAMCNLYDACNLPNTRPAK